MVAVWQILSVHVLNGLLFLGIPNEPLEMQWLVIDSNEGIPVFLLEEGVSWSHSKTVSIRTV